VTTQVVRKLATNVLPLRKHPEPVTEKVNFPTPEPPDAERRIDLPTSPVNIELEITNGF
jgi:hypothetical protein